MTLDKEIIIAGPARDCAHSLPGLLDQLDALAQRFSASHFIFLENDSLDETKAVLNAFAQTHPTCHLEFRDKFGKTHPKRTDRLATLRNRALDIAFDIVQRPQDAYFLMLDLDGANSIIDADHIVKRIAEDDGSWTALFANQEDNYYDLWALEHPVYCPYDIWAKVRNRPEHMSKQEAIETYIKALQFKLPRDGGFIEVDSAFGGMGLYRFSMLEGCRYQGLDSEGHEICDHNALHRDLRAKGGKLFIDCALINGLGTENHTPPQPKWRKKLNKIRLYFKNL